MAHLASWSAVSDTSQADFHNLKRAGTLQFVQTPEAIRNRVLRRESGCAKAIAE